MAFFYLACSPDNLKKTKKRFFILSFLQLFVNLCQIHIEIHILRYNNTMKKLFLFAFAFAASFSAAAQSIYYQDKNNKDMMRHTMRNDVLRNEFILPKNFLCCSS